MQMRNAHLDGQFAASAAILTRRTPFGSYTYCVMDPSIDALDGLVDDEHRNEEPLARDNGLAERSLEPIRK